MLRRADAAYRDRRVHRPLVDDRRVHDLDPDRAGAHGPARLGLPGAGRARVLLGGDPDHAGTRELRPAADVGRRRDGQRGERPPSQHRPPHAARPARPRPNARPPPPAVQLGLGRAADRGRRSPASSAGARCRTRATTSPSSSNSAEGLVAGQTKVRHKAVDLGTVRAVSLSQDLRTVEVAGRDEQPGGRVPDPERPVLGGPPAPQPARSISGLDTLLSGSYIEMDPGLPGDKRQTRVRRAWRSRRRCARTSRAPPSP